MPRHVQKNDLDTVQKLLQSGIDSATSSVNSLSTSVTTQVTSLKDGISLNAAQIKALSSQTTSTSLSPVLVNAIKTASRTLRGVNMAGGEFTNTPPLTFDTLDSFRYIASRSHTIVRLPFLWETIQPTLGNALDPSALLNLKTAVSNIAASGMSVVLDVHNYAKYNGIIYGSNGAFTQAQFVNLWVRLSTEFRDNPTVVGYGLMNEPRNIPTNNNVTGSVQWQQAQQAAVTGIRANGDSTCIMIGGYNSSTLNGWFGSSLSQSTPWITDPLSNIRYEAHVYWDADTTGSYTTTYEASKSAGWTFSGSESDSVRTAVKYYIDTWMTWLKNNNLKGYMGEFGWPSAENGAYPSDSGLWNSLAQLFFDRINLQDGNLVWTTAWATGNRWSTGYKLQLYSSTAGTLSTPLSNAPTLENNARPQSAKITGSGGGTSLTTANANGIAYYTGGSLTTSAGFVYNGTRVGVNNSAPTLGQIQITGPSGSVYVATNGDGILATSSSFYMGTSNSAPAGSNIVWQINGVNTAYLTTSKIQVPGLQITASTTAGQIWTATDTTGNGTWASPAIKRSVSNVTASMTAPALAATDYVYFASNTITLTLPTAFGNTNRYTVYNDGTGTITVAVQSGQSISGPNVSAVTTVTLAANASQTYLSNNANWRIMS